MDTPAASPSPSLLTRSTRIRIVSTTLQSFATATSRRSRRNRSSPTTWRPATSQLLKQKEVPGGYDRSEYEVEQHLYRRVRWHKDSGLRAASRKAPSSTAPRPLYLYGYGSYGISIDMFFNSNLFSLLDRGVTYARSPHPRRRRDGQALARRRPDDEQEEHLHRLHRRRRAPHQARLRIERHAWSSKAAAPAAC